MPGSWFKKKKLGEVKCSTVLLCYIYSPRLCLQQKRAALPLDCFRGNLLLYKMVSEHRVCPVKQTCSFCLFSCLHQILSYKMMHGLLANWFVLFVQVKDYTGSALPPSVEGPTTKIQIDRITPQISRYHHYCCWNDTAKPKITSKNTSQPLPLTTKSGTSWPTHNTGF